MKQWIYGVLVVAVFGCAPGGSETAMTETATTTETTATDTAAPAADQTATAEEISMAEYENKVAEIHTTAGQINIRFFPDVAPNHVKNFIDLAQKGFYAGTKFHRVIPGFMIQGGDPNSIAGDPRTWGTGGSGQNVKAEFNSVSHKRGIVSMARSPQPDSASSQFFIVVADSPHLDRQYSAFGQVTQGMDVVDKIVSGPRSGDRPNNPIAIERIVIRDAAEGETGPTPK